MMLQRLALLLAILGGPATAQTQDLLVRLEEPLGLARLTQPADSTQVPLVIMLPDALGEDGRAEPYVDSLLARGIASLVLGLGEDLDSPVGPTEPAASPAALAAALAWTGRTGHARIGVLGFGLGGRVALAGAVEQPVVALYPRCDGLPVPRAHDALILQGSDATEGCDALDRQAGVRLRVVPGAGHGWDAPGAFWPTSGPMLPDPAGGPRLRATTDLQATLRAAEDVADWFEEMLFGHSYRASRRAAD